MTPGPPSAATPLVAIAALYRSHYGFVWHTVRRFGVLGSRADDAVQDTFVTACRRADELAMPTAKAWLYGIARRIASNYRRTERRAARKHDALAGSTGEIARDRGPEPLIALDRFLARLDPLDRELFVLSEVEGMSGPELAEVFELNVSTAYSRVQALRRRLRVALDAGELDAAVGSARSDRPRASAHGWVLVLAEVGTTSTRMGAFLSFVAAAVITAPLTVAVAEITAAEAAAPPAVASTEPIEIAAPTPAGAQDTALPIAAPPQAIAPDVATMPRLRPRARGEAVATPTSIERDAAMLRDASARLRDGDATNALELTDAHMREFPASRLADARAALRIDALCRLDKPAQARGEAREFVLRHADSPVRARIARSCVADVVVLPGSGQPLLR